MAKEDSSPDVHSSDLAVLIMTQMQHFNAAINSTELVLDTILTNMCLQLQNTIEKSEKHTVLIRSSLRFEIHGTSYGIEYWDVLENEFKSFKQFLESDSLDFHLLCERIKSEVRNTQRAVKFFTVLRERLIKQLPGPSAKKNPHLTLLRNAEKTLNNLYDKSAHGYFRTCIDRIKLVLQLEILVDGASHRLSKYLPHLMKYLYNILEKINKSIDFVKLINGVEHKSQDTLFKELKVFLEYLNELSTAIDDLSKYCLGMNYLAKIYDHNFVGYCWRLFNDFYEEKPYEFLEGSALPLRRVKPLTHLMAELIPREHDHGNSQAFRKEVLSNLFAHHSARKSQGDLLLELFAFPTSEAFIFTTRNLRYSDPSYLSFLVECYGLKLAPGSVVRQVDGPEAHQSSLLQSFLLLKLSDYTDPRPDMHDLSQEGLLMAFIGKFLFAFGNNVLLHCYEGLRYVHEENFNFLKKDRREFKEIRSSQPYKEMMNNLRKRKFPNLNNTTEKDQYSEYFARQSSSSALFEGDLIELENDKQFFFEFADSIKGLSEKQAEAKIATLKKVFCECLFIFRNFFFEVSNFLFEYSLCPCDFLPPADFDDVFLTFENFNDDRLPSRSKEERLSVLLNSDRLYKRLGVICARLACLLDTLYQLLSDVNITGDSEDPNFRALMIEVGALIACGFNVQDDYFKATKVKG